MKFSNIYYLFTFVSVLALSCSDIRGIDDDTSFINTAETSNLGNVFDISNDNSGLVKITPTGEGFTIAVITPGLSGGGTTEVNPGGSANFNYPEGSYTVAIDYKNIAGGSTTATYPLTVTYRAPENLQVNISGETRVSATALYAKSFLVYYGDVPNEVGRPLAVGAELPPHTYPATGGPFVLRVEALSGGAAKTTFTKTLFSFPISFDSPGVEYFFGTFGGGQQFATVDNPSKTGINTSDKVGQFTRGYEGWSGTYSPLNIPINMALGKKITVMVYNPNPALIGANLNVELESSINGPANGVAILKVPVTTSGSWEELVFDFGQISNIPDNAKFSQLVLRFNDSVDGAGDIIYLDNFRLSN